MNGHLISGFAAPLWGKTKGYSGKRAAPVIPTGALVWFDAAGQGFTDGQALTQWNDLSGNGHHLTAHGTVNYRSASGGYIDTGAAGYLLSSSIAAGIGTGDFGWAMVVASSQAAENNIATMIDGLFRTAEWFYKSAKVFLNSTTPTIYVNNGNGTSNPFADNTDYLMEFYRVGSNFTFLCNSTPSSSQNLGSETSNTNFADAALAVGATTSGGNPLQGRVKALIGYARTLTLTEQIQLHNYLKTGKSVY